MSSPELTHWSKCEKAFKKSWRKILEDRKATELSSYSFTHTSQSLNFGISCFVPIVLIGCFAVNFKFPNKHMKHIKYASYGSIGSAVFTNILA